MRAAKKPDELRDSGIDILGRMPWSTHVSLFYETRADLLATIVPFFRAGLKAREHCVWLWSDEKKKRAVEAGLRAAVPTFDRHLERNDIEFVDGRPWLRTNHFDSDGLIRKWRELAARARTGNYAGFRGAGDHTWLERHDWRTFSAFEEKLHAFIINRPIFFICTYPLQSLGASDILDSARTHHLAIARRRGKWDVLESPALKATKEQIKRHNEDLERAIAERTRQLARSEWYLAEGQRLSRSGSFAIDVATGQYSYASPENLRIFGYDPKGPLPRREEIMERIHPDDRARVAEFRRSLAKARQGMALEFRLLLPGRKVRHVYAITHPVVDRSGRVVEIVGSSIDMTERKRAAAKLARARRDARERAIEARYAAAFEERTRLAREIHDSLLQGATGIAAQLRAALEQLDGPPAGAKESIRRTIELAESTIRDARRAVWDMRAPALVEKGFAEAIEEAVRRAAGSIPIDFVVEGKARELSTEAEDTIFRVAQEATLNAVKHAAARRISVTLKYSARGAGLTVRDDGRGFEVERPSGRAGRWGLRGARERADQIGASLSIRSAPGRGTSISLRVPHHRSSAIGVRRKASVART